MIDWARYDTTQAELTYAVANSPMFLLDGIRDGSAAKQIAARESPKAILESFSELLHRDDNTFSWKVKPFVLVAASSLKNDPVLTRDLAEVAQPYGGWVSLLARVVMAGPLPPSFVSVPSAPALNYPTPRKELSSRNSELLLKNET
jgi:hypothetical protein